MNGFRTAMSRYAQFEGRSRRREYWGFVLVLWLIAIAMTALYAIALAATRDGGATWLVGIVLAISGVLVVVLFVPTVTVGWRRCQDVGIPGLVALVGIFIPLLMVVIGLIPGNAGPNQYGPDPKA